MALSIQPPLGRSRRNLVLASTALLAGALAAGWWWASTDQERALNMLVMALASAAVGGVLAYGALKRSARHKHHEVQRRNRQLAPLALLAKRTESVIILSDAKGLATWANPAFEAQSGYTVAELLGKKPGDLLRSPRSSVLARGRLHDAVNNGTAVVLELRNQHKLGQDYWVRLEVQPFHNDKGVLTGFSGVQTDITSLVLERERLSALWKSMPGGVVVLTEDGVISHNNERAEQLLGAEPGGLIGLGCNHPAWAAIDVTGRELQTHEMPVMATLRGGEALQNVQIGLRLPNGQRRWLQVNTELLKAPDGATTGVVASFADVTEVNAQRRMIDVTVDAAGLGTWELGVGTGQLRFNDRWLAMLGYAPDEIAQNVASWRALMHPDDLPLAQRALNGHLADASQLYRVEFRMRHKSGAWHWIMAAGAVVERGSEQQPLRVVGVHIDIAHRKQLEVELANAAHTDALTGLPNRVALQRTLLRCTAPATDAPVPAAALALLVLDIDHFKLINDSLGHEAGDELLRQTAERICAAVHPAQDIARVSGPAAQLARLGGDEFVVLLHPLRDAADAERVAEHLLVVLAQPYRLLGQSIQSSASIGICISQAGADDPETLLRNADIAMYEAKRRGRNRAVVYSKDMHERVRRALDLEAELRVALGRNDELFVLYQPIVHMSTRAWVGVEALVRWRHPYKGVVPPIEFIALAEERGLIQALGLLVLRRACIDMVRWRQQHGEQALRTVSVNLSRLQLADATLPASVAEILQETGLPPQALRLEITESVAAQDDSLIAALQALRSLGVSLSLDDFGTGYSSLSSLDRMPLDVVKIDRSFMTAIVHSDYQKALVSATLRVAYALELEVVAEGVEDELQAGTLLALGCPMAQGYLFGRPVTATEIDQALQAQAVTA